MSKKFGKIIRWVAFAILLVTGVIGGIATLHSLLFSQTINGYNFIVMIGSGVAALALASMVIYARTQMRNRWGTSEGELVPLTTQKIHFTPPVFDDGTRVPAELWYALSKYDFGYSRGIKGARIVKTTALTMFSDAGVKPASLIYVPNFYSSGWEQLAEKPVIASYPHQQALLDSKEVPYAVTKSNSEVGKLLVQEALMYQRTHKYKPKSLLFGWGVASAVLVGLSVLNGAQFDFSSILVGSMILGLFAGFFALFSLRNEFVYALNEEATRIVLDGLAFRKYFKSAKPKGGYSLESKDSELVYASWAVVFGAEDVWERVFRSGTAPETYTSATINRLLNDNRWSSVIDEINERFLSKKSY